MRCKVFNYVILYPEDEKAFIKIDNHPKNMTIVKNVSSSESLTISELFPDKTKNTVYNVLALYSLSQSFDKSYAAKSGYYHHLTTLAEVQNSTLNFSVFKNMNKNFPRSKEIYNELKRTQRYDLDLVDVPVNELRPKLSVYEEEAFCAMIPMKTSLTALHAAFLDYSFGLSIWLLWILSIATALVVWKLLNRFRGDSHWRFLAAVLAMLIGQTIDVRTNRRILTFMLHIFLISTFYMKIIYEGVLTATMFNSIEAARHNTFDELLKSDTKYKFIVTPKVHPWLKTLPSYEKVHDRVSTVPLLKPFLTLASEKFVIVNHCMNIKHKMNLKRPDVARSYYYILPQKLLVHHKGLDVGLASPYLDRWQTIINRAHESGLIKAWEIYFGVKELNRKISGRAHIEEYSDLTVEDILPIVIRTAIFYVLALFIFLCEIFHKDVLSKLSWDLIKIKPKSERKAERPRKLRVRRIQVKPMVEL